MMPLADGSVSQELSSRFRGTLGSNRPERSAVFAEDTVTLRRTAATAGCAEGEHRVALVASRGGAIRYAHTSGSTTFMSYRACNDEMAPQSTTAPRAVLRIEL